MNISDLRIGNFVNSFHGKDEKIDNIEIAGKSKRYIVDGMAQGIKNLKGIPITEAWLKRLGLKNKLSNFIGDYDYFFQRNPDFKISYYMKNSEYSVFFLNQKIASIKYVHQLQNMYFDHKGVELAFI